MKPITRYFYRCHDCLAVAATLEEIKPIHDNHRTRYATCGACGGECEYMGRTSRSSLIQTVLAPACDGRCTAARGPNCDCQCGGANHGSDAVVEVITKESAIPKLAIVKDAAAKGEAFRGLLLEVNNAWNDKYGSVVRRKRSGEYLEGSDYSRYHDGARVMKEINAVKSMTQYAAREKKLTELLSKLKGRKAA